MFHFRATSIAIALSIVTSAACAGEPTLVPQSGLLLLRNGQVLQGEITRAGDYYVVLLSKTSEIRLPTAQVETTCASLDEAYVHRLQKLDPSNGNDRLALVDWCLRLKMFDVAEEQLAIAASQSPNHPNLKLFTDRLAVAREIKPIVPPTKSAGNPAAVGVEQLDQAARDLPRGAVEKFAVTIQPLLINRCGANGCHGPNSKSEFALLRPANGQVANRRFSQRNLYASLQMLDRKDPLNSPLLVMPQKRHGGSPAPVFDKHSATQLEELSSWIKLALEQPAAPQSPAHINPSLNLSTGAPSANMDAAPLANGAAIVAATHETVETDVSDAADGAGPKSDKVKTNANASASTATSGKRTFVPRDAFDPEIFNRHFFGDK